MSNGSVKQDYYEVLGVDRSASDAQIKRAYRQLARKHHPDVNRDTPQAAEVFKEISEAYAVLSDAQRRAQYDRFGHNAPNGSGFGGPPVDIFEIFSSAFGSDPFGFGRTSGHTVPVGQSLRYDLEITLEDVLSGVEREISYPRLVACEACDGTGAAEGSKPRTCATCGGAGRVRVARNTFIGTIATVQECRDCQGVGEVIDDPCDECRGNGVVQREETLTVTIPAGVEAGNELVMRGFGEAPVGGGRVGDLHVRIHVAQHERFVRKGGDLHTELPLTFTKAALGGGATLEGLDGPVEVHVSPGTQTDEVLVVSGRGLRRTNSGRRGDLHVHVRVVTPTNLTPAQRELLVAFAAEGGEDVVPEDEGLFERIGRAILGR